jgi:hypothetical protein
MAAVAIVLTMNLMAVTRAGAATTSPFNRAVSGPFNGTSAFTFGTPCDFVHQIFVATYLADHGRSGSFHIEGCVILSQSGGPPGFAFAGGFTLTTSNRAVLRGTVTGTVGNGGGPCAPGLMPGPLDFTLVLTQGTKQFRHHSGTISLAGTWCSPAVPSTPGPISGVLSGNLS